MSEELRIDIWHWYSIDQALAAVLFSRLCGELEQSPPSPSAEEKKSGLTYTEEGRRRHRAYAIASVLASVAFLEACINELFASAEYENLEVGGNLPEAERQLLVHMAPYLGTRSTLERYQAALTLLSQIPFDQGRMPYQDAALLVRLGGVESQVSSQSHQRSVVALYAQSG